MRVGLMVCHIGFTLCDCMVPDLLCSLYQTKTLSDTKGVGYFSN
jgi:hypothetical protein